VIAFSLEIAIHSNPKKSVGNQGCTATKCRPG
jgi:hypothetical protein